MLIDHVALWTDDLESAAAFWRGHFDAEVTAPYHSRRREGFVSRMVRLPGGGAEIELMTMPSMGHAPAPDHVGWNHIAISVGDQEAVDALAARCHAEGLLLSPPRMTGDGFYEAVISMPDGTPIEITSTRTALHP